MVRCDTVGNDQANEGRDQKRRKVTPKHLTLKDVDFTKRQQTLSNLSVILAGSTKELRTRSDGTLFKKFMFDPSSEHIPVFCFLFSKRLDELERVPRKTASFEWSDPPEKE